MTFYQETKSMKGAVIGTIMPWTGGLSGIPDGWVICDGSERFGADFPLLARSIRDTYRNGTASDALQGSFPDYRNNGVLTKFILPNLTDGKTLMDIETDYFPGGSDPKNNTIDQAPGAADMIIPYIGDNIDNGIPTIFAGDKALKTDVVFTLNVGEGYGGNIRGNTIIDGIGEKIVYIGGRKLGHQHIRSHSHPGQLETVAFSNQVRPGGGVIPWDKIEMRWGYRAWNDTGGEKTASGGVDNMRAIYRWFYSDTNIELINSGSLSSFGSISGFNSGPKGRSVGISSSENPPINLSAQRLRAYPITNLDDYSYKTMAGGNNIPYAQGGNSLSIPGGYQNYYSNDGSSTVANYGVLLSNTLNTFAPGVEGAPTSNSVVAHGHDPFLVNYDQGTLKANSRLIANASIDTLNTELDNSINKAALEITMNTSQPSLTCVYIIRAY